MKPRSTSAPSSCANSSTSSRSPISAKAAVAREVIRVKVRADSRTRAELLQISDVFRAKIVNLSADIPHHRGHGRRGRSPLSRPC